MIIERRNRVATASAQISPFGVPWSKRTPTGGNRLGAQALGYELEHGFDPLARYVELLDDFIDTRIFEVLDDSSNG